MEEVGRLKERAGAPTLVAGSATLVHALVEQDPVDEYRAMVFPVPIADGVWTGPGTSDRKPLRLLHVETFASGVVVLACEAEPCP